MKKKKKVWGRLQLILAVVVAGLAFSGVCCNKASAGMDFPCVQTLAIQPDGKIIRGGDYDSAGVVRFNTDGTVDESFNPGTGTDNERVYALAIQPDGKIVIGGYFETYNGTARNRIARLNANGTLDTSFDPGTGVDWTVYALAIQPDGKIVIGGYFETYNGTARSGIARLNANGSLDTSFDPGTGTDRDSVDTLAIQSDGKIIIGGDFLTYNGTVRNHIARLNTNGTLDTSFDPGLGTHTDTDTDNEYINTIAIQSNGKIIIGGDFIAYNGTARGSIARLNTNGTLDTSFDPGRGVVDSSIGTLTIQPDGKIIIGGSFETYNGTARNRIARLNANGTLDTSFDPGTGANGTVNTTAIQSDGKIIAGGYFGTFNNTAVDFMVRLNTNGTLDTSFGDSTSSVTTNTPSLAYSASKKTKTNITFTFKDLSLTKKQWVKVRLNGRKTTVVRVTRSGNDSLVTVSLKYGKWPKGNYNLLMNYKNQIKVAYVKKGKTKYRKSWQSGSVTAENMLSII